MFRNFDVELSSGKIDSLFNPNREGMFLIFPSVQICNNHSVRFQFRYLSFVKRFVNGLSLRLFYQILCRLCFPYKVISISQFANESTLTEDVNE